VIEGFSHGKLSVAVTIRADVSRAFGHLARGSDLGQGGGGSLSAPPFRGVSYRASYVRFSNHELRLLLVPVQGGEGAHPRQRRAEPVLPAWDEITALAQRFPPVPCRTPAAPPPARWHAPSIFMGSFLFLGQAPPSLHRRRFSVQVVPFVRTYVRPNSSKAAHDGHCED